MQAAKHEIQSELCALLAGLEMVRFLNRIHPFHAEVGLFGNGRNSGRGTGDPSGDVGEFRNSLRMAYRTGWEMAAAAKIGLWLFSR
jgi:hypothetical protein